MSAQSTSVLARLRQPVGTPRGGRQIVGGSPQVSLLPGEVREAGAVAAHRRRLVGVVVVAAAVAIGAVGLAQTGSTTAAERLASAQSQSQMLSTQLGKFNDVRALESRIALGAAAVKVGSSTMIDWETQLGAIEAEMPAGYAVTDISANGATPLIAYPQGDNILEPTRVATVVMTITTGSVGEEFSTWLRDLRTIPAYADATADTTYDKASGDYLVDLTLHLNTKALSAGTWTAQR